jgi:hypothetical protein
MSTSKSAPADDSPENTSSTFDFVAMEHRILAFW